MSIKWRHDPSVGNIEADLFDPATWKTEYPNPAFKQMDAADAFWAANIMARFTNGMIRGLVEEARLTSLESAHQLADLIIKRRDKSVRWGISRTNPVDQFQISNEAAPELTFDNAALRLGVIQQEPRYVIQWAPFDNNPGTTGPICCTVATAEPRAAIPPATWGAPDQDGARYAVAAISTIQREFPNWDRAVRVTIRNRNGRLDVVGIDRPADLPKARVQP